MNLDEFRNALSSDATKENESLKRQLEQQKKTKNTELSSRVKELTESANQDQKDILALQNRCEAHTRFAICGFCDMRFRCGALLNMAEKMAGEMKERRTV